MRIFRLFLTMTLLFFAHASYGAQMAIVSSLQAVIYADQGLTAPIGYVRNGRRLLVGSQARGQGNIVPVVVSGRIAYIQLKDVTLSNQVGEAITSGEQRRELEHPVEAEFEGTEKYDFTKNNYLSVGLAQAQTSSLSDILLSDSVNFTELFIDIDHRPLASRYSFGVGLVYLNITEEEFFIKSLRAHGNLYYRFFRTRFLTLHAMAGLSISGDLRIRIEDQQASSEMAGYQLGAQARLAPRQRIGATLTLGLNSLHPLGLSDINTFSNRYEIGKIAGPFIKAGLVYRL